ncbi:MAG: RNA polymerase-associated protein rapA [Magnetococcales bacterium]|nr:RNA polymerase-associated protein rapA [Magnetococcales bacterium]
MVNKRFSALAVLTSLTLAGSACAAQEDWEVTGYIKNESAFFTQSGPTTGQRTSTVDTAEQKSATLLKMENTLNLYVNGDLTDDTALHAQVKMSYDAAGVEGYKFHRAYSQQDYLRELYLDTTVGGLDLRIGKQQVVWGTADGIKLLDILNPTDWREFVQNTMEDARIPVWMVKAEYEGESAGNYQLVLSQAQENLIPGLTASGDVGQPFLMKGMDSITGPVNGFLNVVPQLGSVANVFSMMAPNAPPNGFGTNLSNFVNYSVDNFASAADPMGVGFAGADILTGIAYNAPPNGVSATTLLVDGGSANWDTTNPNSVFEYMPNATFATFDTFANATSEYRRDHPEDLDGNIGVRYKNSIGANLNFSLNYLYHYDANPYIDLHWEDSTGQKLNVVTTNDAASGLNTVHLQAPGAAAGTYDCSADAGDNPCTLVFTEKMNRIHSIGTSFDTSMETGFLGPIVLRGEFLYQKDVMVPIIDREKLGYGDLAGGLTMVPSDMFKYVLGVESIFMTNLTVSTQFIQFINLDFVEDGQRYTGDQATLHLSNGLAKGSEFREMVSLFLSKPFGEEQQGRWNNITIYEEEGGWWNRFDVEYAFTDDFLGMAEWNNYWGNEDTMFGQFANASNVQIGMKFLF